MDLDPSLYPQSTSFTFLHLSLFVGCAKEITCSREFHIQKLPQLYKIKLKKIGMHQELMSNQKNAMQQIYQESTTTLSKA